MKIGTKNQLVGVLAGVVIALGLSVIPGLSGGVKWILIGCIVLFSPALNRLLGLR